MKAKELAEILMQYPDYEVVIHPEELRGDYLGCPYQQTIDSVETSDWITIPVGERVLQISSKNHFVSEQGYKL